MKIYDKNSKILRCIYSIGSIFQCFMILLAIIGTECCVSFEKVLDLYCIIQF